MSGFYMPTKLISGRNCVLENFEIFRKMGQKAIIVCGRNSAKICGALGHVEKILIANGQEFVLFNKIMPNPTIDVVYEGASLAKSEKADFVVAIGGGSPMDAAKSIAVLAVENVDREDIFKGGFINSLPMIHIPTTAGTGSEVTPYAILTNDAVQSKMTMTSLVMFPKYALLDGSYMENLPYEITVNTAVDALSHSIESMLSIKSDAFSEMSARKSIEMISKHFDELLTGDFEQNTRQDLLEASALGGIAISQTGTTVVHTMGYSFTYFMGTDHGRANGLILGEFLKIGESICPERIEEILTYMGMTTAEEFIDYLKMLLAPDELLSEDEIKKYTDITMRLASKKLDSCFVKIEKEDISDIYRKVGR